MAGILDGPLDRARNTEQHCCGAMGEISMHEQSTKKYACTSVPHSSPPVTAHTDPPHQKVQCSFIEKNCNSCSDILMLVEMARGSLVLWSVLILQSCHLFVRCLAALEDACDCDAVEIVTTTDVVLRKHGQLLGRYGLKGDKT